MIGGEEEESGSGTRRSNLASEFLPHKNILIIFINLALYIGPYLETLKQ